MYICFLAHEVMITQKHISKSGRLGPGGDRVLCKSTDITTTHIRLSGRAFYHNELIWERLCAMWTRGRVSCLHSGVADSISSGRDPSIRG